MVFAGVALRQAANITPKQLYKRLLRDCEKLPKEAQNHYKHSIKQSFLQHVEEPDPQRVQDIIERALKDAEWILSKYSSKNT
ncbi:LYR motif-containing protein 9 [Frankliniella fusca]|uniref:LYR motif-containing protein 9 n=1 Tax=Frankliniella fusca TaxID=407009 RepID=A0AAE1LHA5_9NEOP|nr:LYR motif-containing protein 9 [Frankliniella fusca]